MYDIYIDRMLIPVNPEKITISTKNKNETLSLIDSAEINILKTDGLRDISFKWCSLHSDIRLSTQCKGLINHGII